MKRIIDLILSILFVLLSSCHSNDLSDLDSLFEQKPEIKLSIQLSNIKSGDVGMPIYFACVDSLLIVSEMFNTNFITVYNTIDGQVVNRFASKGNGPNEFLGIGGLYFSNNQLIIQSTMPNRMVYVHKRDLLKTYISFKKIDFNEDNVSYLKISPISEGFFMGTAIINNSNSSDQFAIANKNGEFLRTIDQYPLNKELKSAPNYDLALGFQGTLTPSIDGCYALYSGSLHGVLKFYRFNGKNPQKVKEYVIDFPKFISRANSDNKFYGVQVSEESIAGTISVAVSDDSYYVLFSKKQPREFKSNIIYVFNFNGEPVKKILLDEPVKAIVYSEKENSLLTYREMEEEPRIDIIKLP